MEWVDVAARFSPGGRYILAETGPPGARYPHIFDAGTGEPLEAIPRHRTASLPDDDGLVTFAGGTVELWRIHERRQERPFRTTEERGTIVATHLLDASSDGRYLATGRPKPILGAVTSPVVQVGDLMTGE